MKIARLYPYTGRPRSLSEIATLNGVSRRTLAAHIAAGMTADEAVAFSRRAREHDRYADPDAKPTAGCTYTIEEIREMRATYPLDNAKAFDDDNAARLFVADHPLGVELETIAVLLGCTRERVRQIEATALRKIRRAMRAALDDDREWCGRGPRGVADAAE